VVSTDAVKMGATVESIGVIRAAKFDDEYVFQPMRVKVKQGGTITWTNTGKQAHNATAEDGSWSTGEVAPGASATVTFTKPGTYTYIDKDHPWNMGQVMVE
jgi:plastocyanin